MTSFTYRVVRPGKIPLEFEVSKDAVEFLATHPGYAELHGPNGLIMTKGFLPRPSTHPPGP